MNTVHTSEADIMLDMFMVQRDGVYSFQWKTWLYFHISFYIQFNFTNNTSYTLNKLFHLSYCKNRTNIFFSFIIFKSAFVHSFLLQTNPMGQSCTFYVLAIKDKDAYYVYILGWYNGAQKVPTFPLETLSGYAHMENIMFKSDFVKLHLVNRQNAPPYNFCLSFHYSSNVNYKVPYPFCFLQRTMLLFILTFPIFILSQGKTIFLSVILK